MRTRLSAVVGMGIVIGAACTGPVETQEPTGVTKAIGPEGGLIASEDGRLTVVIPPGALDALLEIRIFAYNNAPISIGPAYRVSPERALALPAAVTYGFAGVDLGGRPPTKLVLGRSVQNDWERLTVASVDEAGLAVTCEDDQLSFGYGLLERFGNGDSTAGDADTSGSSVGDTGDTGDTSGDTTSTETGDSTATDSGSPIRCGDGQAVPGEFCYVEGLTFATGIGPRGVATGDFNADGETDLVVSSSLDDAVIVRLGLGNGLFGAEATYNVGATPAGLAVADLDGDNTPDVVVANEDDADVGVLLGDGAGGLGTQQRFSAGTGPTELLVRDVNERGGLDVLVANAGGNDVGFFSGNGGQLAAMVPFATGGAPLGIATGDFTGNANLDLVAAVASDVVLLAGNGLGGFGAPSAFPIGTQTTAVAAADFNGDADLDVAVADVSNTVTVRLGNGIGGFGGGVPFPTVANPTALVAADVTGDGATDLVVVGEQDGELAVLFGNGVGSFDESQVVSVGASPRAVALADFNDDGVADFAVTNFDDDNTSIVLSFP